MRRPADPDDRRQRFEAFFDEHWSAVLAYARRRLPSLDDAHDVAADTFLVVWRRFDEIPPDRPVPWLYRTAGNVLRNHRRGAGRHLRLVERIESQPAAAPASSPEEGVLVDEAVDRALRRLSDDQRELLLLVAWEGLGNQDVAAVLDISPNAVASRLRRARQALDDALAPDPDDEGRP